MNEAEAEQVTEDEDEDDGKVSRRLFLVTKQEISQIVVAAFTKKDALEPSGWIGSEIDAWHSSVSSSAFEISSLEMLPANFFGKVPVNVSGIEVSPEKTCEEILNDAHWEDWDPSNYKNLIDEFTASGLLNGAAILRPPKDPEEVALYMSLGVYAVRTGVFFTTVNPLPSELEPFFVCYSIRPRGIHSGEAK